MKNDTSLLNQSKSTQVKELKSLNLNGIMQYKSDSIIEKCTMKTESDLVKFIAQLLKEPREDLLADIYKELGKDFLIAILEKTLTIENEGGMLKSSPEAKERKSLGGVFFFLIKHNEGSKAAMKRITRINYHKRNDRKRVYRKLALMSISND